MRPTAADLSSISFGRELAHRGDYAGGAKLLRHIITSKNTHDYEAWYGYVDALAEMCAVAEARGARFSIEPPSRAAVAHAARTDVVDLCNAGILLHSAVFGALKAGIRWHLVAVPAPKPPPKPTPTPPQEIRIVGMPPVEVSSLPTRQTETTIHRDENGDMIGSSQRESDA